MVLFLFIFCSFACASDEAGPAPVDDDVAHREVLARQFGAAIMQGLHQRSLSGSTHGTDGDMSPPDKPLPIPPPPPLPPRRHPLLRRSRSFSDLVLPDESPPAKPQKPKKPVTLAAEFARLIVCQSEDGAERLYSGQVLDISPDCSVLAIVALRFILREPSIFGEMVTGVETCNNSMEIVQRYIHAVCIEMKNRFKNMNESQREQLRQDAKEQIALWQDATAAVPRDDREARFIATGDVKKTKGAREKFPPILADARADLARRSLGKK